MSSRKRKKAGHVASLCVFRDVGFMGMLTARLDGPWIAVFTRQSFTHERNQAISSLRKMILRGWVQRQQACRPTLTPFTVLSTSTFLPRPVGGARSFFSDANRIPFESVCKCECFHNPHIHDQLPAPLANSRRLPRHFAAWKTTNFLLTHPHQIFPTTFAQKRKVTSGEWEYESSAFTWAQSVCIDH
jgi:hypothetical protein